MKKLFLIVFFSLLLLPFASAGFGYNIYPERAATTNFTLVNVNHSFSTDFWDGLDTPADISVSDLSDGGDYIPYVGATTDVDLGSNDFIARNGNFTLDLDVMDDLFVYDESTLYGILSVYGDADFYNDAFFNTSITLSRTGSSILEVETLSDNGSAQIRVLADGTNDLYIYTYSSLAVGNYYGFPRAGSSYVDAQGERLIIGTFDTAPLYLATSQDPRFVITGAGDLMPYDDEYYDIGNNTNRIRDIYVLGEDSGGIHFVEDDGSYGNLSMDDNFNLLWNGFVISNSSKWDRDGTYLSPKSAGDKVIADGGLIIGTGETGIDYNFTFNGETNNGTVIWMEDEDYFEFRDSIFLNTDRRLYFNDIGVNLYSIGDGGLTINTGTKVSITGGLDVSGETNLARNTIIEANLDVMGDLNVSGNFTGNQIYAEVWYHNHTATALTFGTDGLFYNLTLDNSDLNGFTFNDAEDSITPLVDGKYKVSWMASGDGANNEEYYTTILVNGADYDRCEAHKKMTAGGDIVTMTGSCFVDLVTTDYVQLGTANIGGTSTGNYYSATLNLIRIGD